MQELIIQGMQSQIRDRNARAIDTLVTISTVFLSDIAHIIVACEFGEPMIVPLCLADNLWAEGNCFRIGNIELEISVKISYCSHSCCEYGIDATSIIRNHTQESGLPMPFLWLWNYMLNGYDANLVMNAGIYLCNNFITGDGYTIGRRMEKVNELLAGIRKKLMSIRESPTSEL